MALLTISLLIGLTAAFVLWAIEAFRLLFMLYGEAKERSGVVLPGLHVALSVVRQSLGDPAYRRRWLGLAALTAILLGACALAPFALRA